MQKKNNGDKTLENCEMWEVWKRETADFFRNSLNNESDEVFKNVSEFSK
jgi:hypothetical protein